MAQNQRLHRLSHVEDSPNVLSLMSPTRFTTASQLITQNAQTGKKSKNATVKIKGNSGFKALRRKRQSVELMAVNMLDSNVTTTAGKNTPELRQRDPEEILRDVRKTFRIKVLMPLWFFMGFRNESHRLKVKKLFQKGRTTLLPLYPDDQFIVCWRLVYRFTLLCSVVIYPFYIALIESSEPPWLYILIILDIIFAINMLLKFVSAYVDSNSTLQSKWKDIWYYYVTGWMVYDVLAQLPLHYYNQETKLLKMIWVLKYFMESNEKDFYNIEKTNNQHKLEDSFNRGHGFTEIFETALVLGRIFLNVLLITHIFSCAWYFAARMHSFNENTWVAILKYQDQDLITLYTTSFYWATQTITVVGCGDIYGNNYGEYLVTCIWMWFGVGCYSFTIGNIGALLSQYNSQQEFEEQMNLFEQLAYITKMPDHTKQDVEFFLQYNQNENPIWSSESKKSLFLGLPVNLRRYTAVSCHYQMFLQVQFLQQDIHFLEEIAQSLRLFYVKKGNLIYRSGQSSNEIYFLLSGEVRIMLQNRHTLLNIAVGAIFGEIEVMEKRSRQNFAYAIKDSQVMICPATLFLEKLKSNPALNFEFEQLYRRRNILIENLSKVKKKQAQQLKRSKNFILDDKILNHSPRGTVREINKMVMLTTSNQYSMELLTELIGQRLSRQHRVYKKFRKAVNKLIRLSNLLGPGFLNHIDKPNEHVPKSSNKAKNHRNSFGASQHTVFSRINKDDAISKLLDKHYVERMIRLTIMKNRKMSPKKRGFDNAYKEPQPYWTKKIAIQQSKWASQATLELTKKKLVTHRNIFKKQMRNIGLIHQANDVLTQLTSLSKISNEESFLKFEIFESRKDINDEIAYIRQLIHDKADPSIDVSSLESLEIE